jgi:hypothetical protein
MFLRGLPQKTAFLVYVLMGVTFWVVGEIIESDAYEERVTQLLPPSSRKRHNRHFIDLSVICVIMNSFALFYSLTTNYASYCIFYIALLSFYQVLFRIIS